MLIFLVELGRVLDIVKFAVHAHAGETGLAPFQHFLAIFTLAPAHHGGEQIIARPLRQGDDPVDHLADRLRGDRLAGRRAVRHADARPEQAHIIVDLGHRGHGGARVLAGGLLLDGDGGGQALDMLHIGLLHHLQKLARISGQALDITPLPLGINGVERQAGLARAGQAGDDDQLVARQIDVDALEIMLARAADGNMGKAHGWRCSANVLVGQVGRWDPVGRAPHWVASIWYHGGAMPEEPVDGRSVACDRALCRCPA